MMRGILVFCGGYDGTGDQPVNIYAGGIDTIEGEDLHSGGVVAKISFTLFLSPASDKDKGKHLIGIYFFDQNGEKANDGFLGEIEIEDDLELKIITAQSSLFFPDYGTYLASAVIGKRQRKLLDERIITRRLLLCHPLVEPLKFLLQKGAVRMRQKGRRRENILLSAAASAAVRWYKYLNRKKNVLRAEY